MKVNPFARISALSLVVAFLGSLASVSAAPNAAAPAAGPKVHHVVMQVSGPDPAIMNLALNNISNMTNYYEKKGESVVIEVVAYGPGFTMLREDTSPVKDRIKSMKEGGFPNVTFSACGVTQKALEKAEGKKIDIISQAHIVPAGAVRITELEEQGYTYMRL